MWVQTLPRAWPHSQKYQDRAGGFLPTSMIQRHRDLWMNIIVILTQHVFLKQSHTDCLGMCSPRPIPRCAQQRQILKL